MEANVSKYTNAIGSGKQAMTQRQKRKGGRGMKEGWEYKKLGEVCSPKKEIKRAPKVFAPNDTIKYIDISSIDNSTQRMTSYSNFIMSDAPSRAQQCVIKGDVIVSTVRPNLKNIAIVDSDDNNLVASSGFCVLRPCNIERDYLFHYIKSVKFTNHIMGLTTGANYPAVRSSDILESTIPVPPLSTQHTIVSELDKINELIRLKKEQLKDYDNLAQSIFYEMFGDPVMNEKGWDVESLGKVCDVRDGTHDSPQYLQESPYILITSKNLVNGKIDYSNVNYISEEDYIAINKRSQVDDGDIIMAMIGTIGNPIIVKLEERKFCIKNVALIKFFNESLVSNKYIHSLLNNDSYLSFIKSQNKGGTQKFVALGTIRKLPIPIPPLSFQQQFAQRIELIEKQKAEVQRTIADLETLLASRMQYWFD